MRVYLRGLQRAALKSLRTMDTDDFDRREAENNATITSVFDGLMSGQYDYAYISGTDLVYLYTRSARITGVQKTTFWRRGDELTPLSDQQYPDAKSWERDGYPDRAWLNIGAV